MSESNEIRIVPVGSLHAGSVQTRTERNYYRGRNGGFVSGASFSAVRPAKIYDTGGNG